MRVRQDSSVSLSYAGMEFRLNSAGQTSPSSSHTTPFSCLSMNLTVTLQVPDLVSSSLEVAVMIAVPSVTPVTTPFSSTTATASLSEVQVTDSSRPQGRTLAVSWMLPVPMITASAGSTVTEVTSVPSSSALKLIL